VKCFFKVVTKLPKKINVCETFSEHGRRLNSPDLIEHQNDTETISEIPDVPLILPATKGKSSKFEL
jgi:hypothetical protein